MDFQKIINEIYTTCNSETDKGKVANYIPELKKIDPTKFGICLNTLNNNTYGVGNFNEKFSIQSITKVFALTLALKLIGEKVWKRVGVEPSGDPFNSLVQLEFEKGIPRNPLINSGALVICDILVSNLKNPKEEFLGFVQKLSNNNAINFNKTVAASEKKCGFKNAAHINLMKSFGNIKNSVETVLDFYYHMCSIEMTCNELSSSFLVYANEGKLPYNNEEIISKSIAKRINATTLLCGLYDEAGNFAFKVGLPGKSGVGGGLVAIHPNKYAIAVWSPKLNKKGNSNKGFKALELFTTKTELSIF
ncbi:L-glutaminase [Lutibacter oricola]|uniref:Glutaminase n=1 Tax=Lutibacter oricola TaxID=762486 RepID=A0A1H2QMB3_9FLAO|nr:glutaminase [Lutibacter oricola]SDW08292.1 L-glutaminase [Lutibacter oricola]